VTDRIYGLRNADRTDPMLGLIRVNAAGIGSEQRYSRILRDHLRAQHGSARPTGRPSRTEPASAPSRSFGPMRWPEPRRPRSAVTHRGSLGSTGGKRDARDATPRKLGIQTPRGRPRIIRQRVGSVAGKMVSDFGWLVAEWHPTKNDRKPSEVRGLGRHRLGKCSRGPDHEWPATVRSRTIGGTGCRYCTGCEVAPSQSIVVTHPDIAAQWHPTRNGDLRPEQFTYGSHKEIWWQCLRCRGHTWKARISSRTSMLTQCDLGACKRYRGGRPRKVGNDAA
jgi:hypothetical protein